MLIACIGINKRLIWRIIRIVRRVRVRRGRRVGRVSRVSRARGGARMNMVLMSLMIERMSMASIV